MILSSAIPGVSSSILCIFVGLLYVPLLAIPMNIIGNTFGNLTSFEILRRLERSKRMEKLLNYVESFKHRFIGISLAFSTPFIPSVLVDYACVQMKLPTRTRILATLIGVAPLSVVYAVSGDLLLNICPIRIPLVSVLDILLFISLVIYFIHFRKDYAKENGALELLIKPYDTYQTFDSNGEPTSDEQKQLISQLTDLGYSFDGLQTGYPGGEPDWHYVKDLSGIAEKDLIKSFSKKGKPLVKKARTFGIKLKKLKRDELSIFKEITSATSDRREYSDKSLDYYQNFYDAFGDNADFMVATLNFQDYFDHLESDQAKLGARIVKLQADLEANPKSEKKQNQLRELSSQFETFDVRKGEATAFIDKYGQEDIVLAGSLFVYTLQESVYLFSGSYPEFNKFYAPALLQEYVMTQAIKRGVSFYNFLGIMGIFDGSDGVLRFKQNFNGYIVRKMGTFRYYPQPLKYKAIQGVKKLLGRH